MAGHNGEAGDSYSLGEVRHCRATVGFTHKGEPSQDARLFRASLAFADKGVVQYAREHTPYQLWMGVFFWQEVRHPTALVAVTGSGCRSPLIADCPNQTKPNNFD